MAPAPWILVNPREAAVRQAALRLRHIRSRPTSADQSSGVTLLKRKMNPGSDRPPMSVKLPSSRQSASSLKAPAVRTCQGPDRPGRELRATTACRLAALLATKH